MESGFTFGGKPYNPIGSNDANNLFDSSNVTAKRDGSVLERLEEIADDVDSIGTAVGAGTSGTADGGTTTTLVDAALTQADDYWVGMRLVMTTGANAGIARVVTDFVAATDTLTVSPAFPSAVAAGDAYELVADPMGVPTADDAGNGSLAQVVGNKTDAPASTRDGTKSVVSLVAGVFDRIAKPAADASGNNLIGEMIGQKADTATTTVGTTASLMRYVKGLVQAGVAASGTADGGTTTTLVDAALTQADDYWNGAVLVMLSGSASGQSRTVTDFDAATDTLTVSPALGAAVAAGDTYVLVPAGLGVPTADDTGNGSLAQVVGNKADAANASSVGTTKSLMSYVKQAVNLSFVTSADNAANANVNHVVGNKTDAAVESVGTTASLMGYTKGLVNNVGAWTTPALATVACAASTTTTLLAEVATTRPTEAVVNVDISNLTVSATIDVLVDAGAAGTTATVLDRLTVDPTASPYDVVKLVPIQFYALADYSVRITTGAEGASRDVHVRESRRVTA